MGILKPIRHLRLPDRLEHTAVSDDGRRFVMCARSGKCSWYDSDLAQLGEFNFGPGVEWVQLDATGLRLLVGFWDHIDGYATSSKPSLLFRLDIPGTFLQCCVFARDGQELCVASWGDEPILSAWDLASSTRIAHAPLPERGGAGYTLIPHPEGEAMAAVACSGQSEEWMFWATYADGRLRVYDQPEIEDVSFPSFHPTGREFVSHHERFGLCRMGFPSGELLAAVDNPDEHFGYDIHFLRDDRLLAWQEGHALYELDLATLRPIRAVLPGADGLTFGQDSFFSGQSWRLAGGRLLTSDSQHDQNFRNRIDTLRLWDASSLFSPIAGPDPARPYSKLLVEGA